MNFVPKRFILRMRLGPLSMPDAMNFLEANIEDGDKNENEKKLQMNEVMRSLLEGAGYRNLSSSWKATWKKTKLNCSAFSQKG